jgi:hypothetical protein
MEPKRVKLVDSFQEMKEFVGSEDIVSRLPPELSFGQVFHYVPQCMTISCSLVCKSWYNLFSFRIGTVKEEDVWTFIGKEGYLNMLIWLNALNKKVHKNVLRSAASSGHLHILKWFDSMDWFRSVTQDFDTIGKTLTKHSAKGGQLDVLDWLAERGLLQWSKSASLLAAQEGHLSVLKWAFDRNLCIPSDSSRYAAEYSHLDILDWLYSVRNKLYGGGLESWPITAIIYSAASRGRLEVLEWFKNVNPPWVKAKVLCRETAEKAARYSHKHILLWLIQNKFRLSTCKRLCSFAAIDGNYDLVLWLHEQGCALEGFVVRNSISGGNVKLVAWVMERINRKVNTTDIEFTIQKGRLEVLNYFYEQPYCRPLITTPSNLLFAVKNFEYEIAKWLVTKGCKLVPELCAIAATAKNADGLKFLREIGCPWDTFVGY